MSTTIETYEFAAMKFRILTTTSNCASHPTTTLIAPSGTVILGGGAYVNWRDPPCAPSPSPQGNLLTAMYPNDAGTTWTVASKDHNLASTATVTAYCIVAEMRDGSPIPAGAYTVVSATSDKVSHPTTSANLPNAFVVVGGGARVDWAGNGSLLFASYPPSLHGWVGSAKDHDVSDPSTITVWAIGLNKAFLMRYRMVVGIRELTSSTPVNRPLTTFVLAGFYLTGVGARVNWSMNGNLLTASFPQDHRTVVVEGKDHGASDPSTITAYAVGFAG